MGSNTKYYANNPVAKRDFKQTFFWADQANKKITQLSEFAEAFLEKCQLSKLITKYVVLNESQQMLMVLRPYQYHAVEGNRRAGQELREVRLYLAYHRFRQDPDLFQDRTNSHAFPACTQGRVCGGP